MDDDKYVYYNIKSENDVVTLTVRDLKKKTLMQDAPVPSQWHSDLDLSDFENMKELRMRVENFLKRQGSKACADFKKGGSLQGLETGQRKPPIKAPMQLQSDSEASKPTKHSGSVKMDDGQFIQYYIMCSSDEVKLTVQNVQTKAKMIQDVTVPAKLYQDL